MSIATLEPALSSPQVTFSKLAPVFLVDSIEPCLKFWVDRLGFEVRVQVENEGNLEFVSLGRDDVEVMYRTRASMNQDTPGVADGLHGPWVVLYLEVDNLEELMPKLEGAEVIIPLRQTCLGTQEIYVNEPSGRIVAITSRYRDAA